MPTRDDAQALLEQLAGPQATLRDDQWTAIEALVIQRRQALVVQRTGWGKSAVYFVSTALRRAQGAGPSIIISPLLALMRDQVAAAARAGIRAVTMNSANAQDWGDVSAALAADDRPGDADLAPGQYRVLTTTLNDEDSTLPVETAAEANAS